MKDITFDDLFGDQEIDFECPNCNEVFQVEFSMISKDNAEIQCLHCKTDIVVQHDETTKKTLNDSGKELKNYNKTFGNLEKAFKKFK